jgi:hypothetical protein
MKAIRTAFASPGVTSAALDYYRCALGTAADAGQHAELQRRIGVEPIRVPCLYLHGDQDGCIGYAVASGMAELFPTASTAACCPASDTSCIWSGPTT